MSDVLSTYIKQRYDDGCRNRRDIELKWEKNREFFLGIATDQWKKKEGEEWRSKSFPGSTHQKVIYAMCLVLDAVLSGGQIPFMYKPSGFDKNRVRVGGPVDPKTVERAIDDMTRLTQQQLVDTKAEASYMKNVLSAALYGWTYGKFVVQNVTRSGFEPMQPEVPGIMDWRRLPQTAQQWAKWEESFLAPGYVYVPIWDIFRDWETDDLHECQYVGQRQIVNNHWLKSKKGKPFFIDTNIDAAIVAYKNRGMVNDPNIVNEPDQGHLTPAIRDTQARVNSQRYFEYWGRVPRTIIEAFEAELAAKGFTSSSLMTEEDSGDEVEVCACTYNDEFTVRYVRTTPDMRPFFQARWEDPGDELAPMGVADNCQQMHNVLKGTFRAIEDNVKLSSNVILAVKERYIKEMPKEFLPGQILLLTEDCDDAKKAIQGVEIPNVTGALQQLLGIVLKFLDEDSMVPKLQQGIKEPGEQTAMEAGMRQAASSKYIGMAIRNLDIGIIEPLISEFYKYNMNDPSIQVGKGNYVVQSLGFTSFINKTTRIHSLQQVLTLALSSPAMQNETKVRFLFEEIVKALDIDPDQGLKTPEEKQAESEAQAQSPEAQLQLAGAQAGVKKVESEAIKNESIAQKNAAAAQKHTVDAHVNLNEEVRESLKPETPENEPVGEREAGVAGTGG